MARTVAIGIQDFLFFKGQRSLNGQGQGIF